MPHGFFIGFPLFSLRVQNKRMQPSLDLFVSVSLSCGFYLVKLFLADFVPFRHLYHPILFYHSFVFFHRGSIEE
jgi:hypothetical protein